MPISNIFLRYEDSIISFYLIFTWGLLDSLAYLETISIEAVKIGGCLRLNL